MSTELRWMGIHAHGECIEGQQLRYCGIGVGFEDVIIDGNPEEMKVRRLCSQLTTVLYDAYTFVQFVAYYTKGEKVIAVARYLVLNRVPNARCPDV